VPEGNYRNYKRKAWKFGSETKIFAAFMWSGLRVLKALPFIFILVRPPSATLSQRQIDWCFGILGAVLSLLVRPVADMSPLLPVTACFGIMVTGISIQIMAKLALGRAFGIVVADRGVTVWGPYRMVRHPMYAG